MDPKTYRIGSRWIFPATSPPIPDGMIEIEDRIIRSVGPRKGQKLDLDLGSSAIIPGLVNAHTHLDLNDATYSKACNGPIPWLENVIAFRRSRQPKQVSEATIAGDFESLQVGVRTVGDIRGEDDIGPKILNLRRVTYVEVLGLSSARQSQMFTRFEKKSGGYPWNDLIRLGFSPHAPYSTSKQLFEFSSTIALPVCSHVGEFIEEEQLLKEHKGPFAEFLKKYGIWHPEELAPSWDWILQTLPAGSLIAHGNYLKADLLLKKNHSVVYCPRTHANFGHPPHPFREFLAAGINVCLGTDSRASNLDLDLFAEAVFLHRLYPDFPGDELLRMLTINGAKALSFDSITGSLEIGRPANMVVIPIEDFGQDPFEILFNSKSSLRTPRLSMDNGRWLDMSPKCDMFGFTRS